MIHPTPKQARALELRRQGLKWREVAEALGTTKSAAILAAERAKIKEYRLADAEKERHARFVQQVADQVRAALEAPAPQPFLFSDTTVLFNEETYLLAEMLRPPFGVFVAPDGTVAYQWQWNAEE